MATEPVPSPPPDAGPLPAPRHVGAGSQARAASRTLWHRFLQRIGWELPPLPALPPVQRRPWLGSALSFGRESRRLPESYTRWFPLTPVEDPEELVGRAAEMEGLRDAFARWQHGQPTAVLITGIRGSGRTSLLNCASQTFLSGTEVLHAELNQRWRRPEDMRAYFGELLRLPTGADLNDVLKSRPRVVAVKEIERGYLRVPGGLGAMEEFLDLVQDTSRTVLWLVTLSELPRRLLNATLQFSRCFSHRINIGPSSREMMAAALLQRHSRSGLSLVFAAPPAQHSRLRRLLVESEPDHLFFDSLLRQCEGVFRAGIELWLNSIERIDAGTVFLRLPAAPHYRLLRNEFTADDLYLLKAIAQHGSLRPEEAAEVLAWSVEECRRRMDRMADMQILEREPPGGPYRIRSQAIGFMRDLLDFHNMID